MSKMVAASFPHPVVGEFAARSGKCCYGMFNRHGGVSDGPYATLNIGRALDDLPEAVAENRRLVKAALRLPRLLSARQVHGRDVYCLTEPLATDTAIDAVDALVTDLPGIGLMIQQADCQAVLLFDPVRQVIGAVHCGWRGSVQGILAETISVMAKHYGSKPADLLAIVSPSLGPCCGEFVNFREELPPEFVPFMVRGKEKYFDFWRITEYQLMAAGMMQDHIRIEGTCTCCSGDYFSYRRARRESGGLTGRNCSVIALRQE